MFENVDLQLVDWSRAQFALTAMYHWIFVPLTLGLSFIIAFMETKYVISKDEKWKKITKFWMTLFGINFAIGVATGIIMEFQFGTNWSNYSWFVGDIFGAPLAIEGIFAFFLETTFIAIMFFGWNKLGKKTHLFSTWMVAVGSNLSAFWILVANSWMQNPTGTQFNPETARNEMTSFADVISPEAVTKFLHTVTSSYLLASIFVIGVSSWFILKNRNLILAKRSIFIASIFGLLASFSVAWTGDISGNQMAKNQPMKLAAMEGLYQGQNGAGLVVVGMLNNSKKYNNNEDPFIFKIEIPKALSFLAKRDLNAFVPGINDIIDGNKKQNILSFEEKKEKGIYALNKLEEYKKSVKTGDNNKAKEIANLFRTKDFQNNYFNYFGYALIKNKMDLIPNVSMTFYSFHIMVGLGFMFIMVFILFWFYGRKDKLIKKKWLLRLGVLCIPLVYITSQMGWIVAEVGRQPWIVQGIMPTSVATSNINVGMVQTTFWIFAVVFTLLLIAEMQIMFSTIKKYKEE